MTGDLFELPAGTVSAVFGVEYRNDELESDPDEVARTGNMVNFFADQGATGQADIFEVFGEAEIPILTDMELAEELTVNVSARFTEQEFYGSAWTYSAKMNYEPTEFLKIRGTYGTSFRAPNLREFFLNGQTGFGPSSTDPCIVPQAAIVGGVYTESEDPRSPELLAACVADGVDPTALGITGAPGVEILTGGTTELFAETSTGWSAGFVFDQPFIDDVTIRLGVTYFNQEVENSIEEPSTGFITDACYGSGPPLTSAFCNRITRGPDGFISLLDTSFINIGLLQVRGADFNFLYSQDVEMMSEEFTLSLDLTATRIFETFVEILGETDDEAGEIGTPEWRGLGTAIIGWSDFRILWRTQWIGEQEEDRPNASFFNAFETCELVDPDNPINPNPRDPDCLANNLAKDYTENYYLHSASITWAPDTWQITLGVSNVFDVLPEFVDADSNYGTNGANVPPGVGYDTYGRTVFLNVMKAF
jgi:iron complex outermembrane receptor protein